MPIVLVDISRFDPLIQRPRIEKIIKIAADEFSVNIESILKSRKTGQLKNNPTKAVRYIAQKVWDYWLKEMIGFLNLNYYGTVGNAISMIANELNEDSEFHLKINAIIKRLHP